MDAEIKAKLLEMLMEDMDELAVSKLKKPKAMEVEIEAKEISPEEIKEKMMPSEDSSVLSSEEPEDDEDYGDSRLMQRIKELKAKKM